MDREIIMEQTQALLEPEFEQRWPYANTSTVLIKLYKIIEETAVGIPTNKLTTKGLFDACMKQI